MWGPLAGENGPVGRIPAGRRRGIVSSFGLVLAWALVAVGGGFALLYAVPELQLVNRRVAMIAAFIPVGIVAWSLALVLFLAAGRGWEKLAALVAVAGLALQLSWISGYVPARTLVPGPVGTSLFTLNARCDSKDREDLVRVLGERGPGVVVIVGAPERLRGYLDESGVLDGHPYRRFFPMGHLPSCGTAVYARVPVGEVADSPVPAVRLAVEGGPVVLVPADVPGPQDGVSAWEQEIAALGETAAGQVAAGWPVVVAGDFNAVREHLPFRRLVDGGLVRGGLAGGESAGAGLVNAAEAAGGGWMPTYRADRPPWPPVIEIDHVLVSGGVEVGSIETVRVGGHAHLALLAWVRVGQ